MEHFVYIIYSQTLDVYYKGYSINVEKRLEYHLTSKNKYTSKAKDWVIVFIHSYDNKAEALKYEKKLKRQNRKYILWLLNQDLNEMS